MFQKLISFISAATLVAVLMAPFSSRGLDQPGPEETGEQTYGPGNPAPLSEASAGLQIIDAQNFEPTAQQTLALSVTADVDAPKVFYDTTDGVSVLVIRLRPFYFSQAVTFQLFDTSATSGTIGGDAEHDGSIWSSMPPLPAPTNGGQFGSLSVTIPAGQPAVVYYRPPARNILYQQDGGQEQGLTIFVYAGAHAGGKTISSGDVTLVPPDELLVHGFLSGPTSMETLGTALNASASSSTPSGQSGAKVAYIDWSTANDSGFPAAAPLVIEAVLKRLSLDRIVYQAITQVDAVGHSMGGVLCLWYAENLGNVAFNRPSIYIILDAGNVDDVWDGKQYPYVRANNFGQGDFRRIISIDSPLLGSPFANALIGFLENSSNIQIAAFASVIQQAGGSGDGAALVDLADNSQAMGELLQNARDVGALWMPVECEAGPTEGAPNLASAGIIGFALAKVGASLFFNGIDPLSNTYDASIGLTPQNSDMVVTEQSQGFAAGGADTPLYYRVQSTAHTQAESNTTVIQYVQHALGEYYVVPPGTGTATPGYQMFNKGF
ncbi:MAG: hypothetical protein HKL96_09135 [Phycisphaerales bacterium]|nr:hypothetical protein [Phycisphaerales bacterium]